MPAAGTARHRQRYLSAVAVGSMEKAMASAYEIRMLPKEYVCAPYRERLLKQYLAGLEALEWALSEHSTDDWFGSAAPNLADVDAVIAFDQGMIVAKKELSEVELPLLATLSERANKLSGFATTRWQPETSNS